MDLITRRVPAKNIGLPKWAKALLKKHGLKENETQVIRKGITPEDTKFKDGERSSVDYITTKSVDRDGEIVVPKGAILDHYRKNPVVLFGHDYKSIPIGKSLWIKADEKGLIAKTQYAKHAKAEEIYQYRKDGFPMAKSIGFIPLSSVEEADFGTLDLKALGLVEADLKGATRVYPEWLMLEYSDVPIPSNPDALQLAISKGILTIEEAKVAAVKNEAFVLELAEPEEKGVIVEAVDTPEGPMPVVEEEESVEDHKNVEAENVEEEMLKERYGKEFSSQEDSEEDEIEDEAAIEKEAEEENELVITFEEEPEQHPASSAGLYPSFKNVEGVSERWNKSLSKEFDIVTLEVEPSSVFYDIASKWLECKVRDIYVHSYGIPSALMGTELTGLEHALSNHDLISVRNFSSDGSESPPKYDVIQLTSEKSNDFLIDGLGFYQAEESRIIVMRRMGYYGIYITAFSSVKDKPVSIKVFSEARKWAEENNLLKGESFSLGGEFLEKTEDDWSSIFLTEKNETAVKRMTELINKKGKDLANRGTIMMGPPGTGKTLSGRVIRNKVDSTFIWVSARDFMYSGAVGGIEYGFSLARSLAPTVLFIEDIDNWLHDRACDLLKTEMDGLAKSSGIITILTSNYPERLPPALIDRPGRFHDILNFSLPNMEIRIRMIKEWAKGIDEESISEIASQTVGFSGAHMFELISFAKTVVEEGIDIAIDDAILISLKKIKEQRELISQLQSSGKVKEEEDVASEIEKQSLEDLEVVEKSGRVLSKKTRSIMTEAINSMGKATAELGELIEAADSKPDADEVVIEVADQEDKSKSGDNTFDFLDENKLKIAIAEAFKDLLRDHAKVDVGAVVKERLNLAKGRVF